MPVIVIVVRLTRAVPVALDEHPDDIMLRHDAAQGALRIRRLNPRKPRCIVCKRVIPILLSAALVVPSAAFAQSSPVRVHRPLSVVFDGGLAAGSPGAGPAVGGRLTFDLNDRVAIEGAGTWAGRGSGADAGSITASLLVNLTRADRKAVPYATLGGGWYRAMFGIGDSAAFVSPGGRKLYR